MELINFIPEQLMILVAAIFILGVFLKKTPMVQDWFIPWILLVIGILGSIALNGANPKSVVQGIVCVGVATLSNQLFKQTAEGFTINKKEEEL